MFRFLMWYVRCILLSFEYVVVDMIWVCFKGIMFEFKVLSFGYIERYDCFVLVFG